MPIRRAARSLRLLPIVLALIATSAAAADKLRVGTPEPTAFVFSVLDVGIGGGFFKKYGLDVERIDFAGGAKLHQAMASGDLDMIVGTGSDLLFLSRGVKEKAVAAYANDLSSLALIVPGGLTGEAGGRSQGQDGGGHHHGSFTSWIARRLAVMDGLKADDIKLAYLGAQSGLVAGLMAKDVDAIIGTSAAASRCNRKAAPASSCAPATRSPISSPTCSLPATR